MTACSDRACLMIACAVLVVLVGTLAIASFPIEFLDGSAGFWQYPKGDYAQHIIGGRYFIADAWRWPLLIVPGLGLPPGTNIGLTDSIPIAALVAKLARGWYGYLRPYLPIFILICCMAQGPACAIGLYVLGVRNVPALILGGIIAVFTPVLLFRFNHAALCAQFLLLLGLAVHLHLARGTSRRVVLLYHLPILVTALIVHIYLFAMTVAILLASLLQGLWAERLTIPAALAQLAMMTVVIGAVMWTCGYLGLGPIPMKPYGQWPLDLTAFFSPAPSGIFGIPAMPHDRNGEDFAWLGAGILLLLVAALIGSWRGLGGLARAYLPTIVVCGMLVVFAITYAVRIGSTLILGIGPERMRQAVLGGPGHGGTLHLLLGSLGPADYVRIGLYGLLLAGLAALIVRWAWQWRKLRFLRFIGLVMLVWIVSLAVRPTITALIISSFQASARFAWPVIYLITLVAIAGVWKAYPPRIALTLLVAALALQVYDTAPLWKHLRHEASAEPAQPPDQDAVLAAASQADRVTFVRTYLCAYVEPVEPDARDAVLDKLDDLQVLVSRFVRPTSSVRNSRMTATDIEALTARCAGERQAAQAQLDAPGTMTLVLDDMPAEASLRTMLLQHPGCLELSNAVMCTAHR